MRKISLVIAGAFLIFQACKQSKTSKTTSVKEPVIASIGTQPIYTSEFKYVYNKNNATTEDAYTESSIKDYLNLYINFRLKVKEAEEMGQDTSKSFIKELDGYKKQLSQPYFTEKSVTEKLSKEAYERMKEEINASHILIRLNPDADPKDTLIAFNKISDIRAKVTKGESFEALAQQYSEDPSAKTNKGNLGYFTAFGTIYPFETAAYNTPIGSISAPVRTQFGYHLVKVNNKRKSQGTLKTAHIMIRSGEGMTPSDSIAAKQKIEEIYKKLQEGETWDVLVSQFSEDGNSKNKGGELAPFSAGKMIPSFEEAAFALQTPGQYSAPIMTPYGWHIIKLIERKPLESYETLEPTIKQKVAKDRGEVNRKALIERLKTEDQFAENTKAVDAAIAKGDSTLLTGKWSYTVDAKNNPTLFTIGKSTYSQNDFFAFVKQKQKAKKNISVNQLMKNMYKDFSEESLIAYEEAHLESKYVDYKMLVKEYRDGILLFQMMDDKVWSKAIEDTAGLKKFFNDNRSKFTWETRTTSQIFSLSSKESLDKLKAELAKGKYPVKDHQKKEISFDEKKFDLSADEQKKLEVVAHEMTKNKTWVAEITASADFKEGNTVATQRSESIKSFLEKEGIDASRIVSTTKLGSKTSKDKAGDRKASITMLTTSAKELEKYFNANAPLSLQVTEGTFQKNDNELLKNAEWKVGSQTFEKDGRTVYIIISKIEDPRPKNFDEARGLIISEYQSYLEQEWIKQLKQKYPVVINEEQVKSLVKK